MTRESIISHCAALALGATGWCMLASLHSDSLDTDEHQAETEQQARTRSHSSHTPLTTRPQTLLSELAHTEMESHMRKKIKGEILLEWANNDPIGLLDYLDSRPWPAGRYSFTSPVDAAFNKLAKTNPDYLFQYAKENGCFSALSALTHHGNPYSTLHLYLSQNPGNIPSDTFQELFRSASLIDPEFYRSIASIEDPEGKLEAFRGAGEALFEHQRYDTYFSILQELNQPQQTKELAINFADNLIANSADPRLILALPAELQAIAIKEAIGNAIATSSDQYAQTLLDTYIKNNWLDQHLENAQLLIQSASGNTETSNPSSWKTWALQLPDTQQTTPIRNMAIRSWILSEPTQWRTIYELPNQNLRDIAYTAALSQIDLEKEADSIPWIKAQIKDPALRKAADQAVLYQQRDPFGDPFEENDPFDVSDENNHDPFNPLGNRLVK